MFVWHPKATFSLSAVTTFAVLVSASLFSLGSVTTYAQARTNSRVSRSSSVTSSRTSTTSSNVSTVSSSSVRYDLSSSSSLANSFSSSFNSSTNRSFSSSFSVFSSSFSPYSTSSSLAPDRQAAADAGVYVAQQRYVYNQRTGGWDLVSRGINYSFARCADLYNLNVLGVADYLDSISQSHYLKDPSLREEYKNKYRSCEHYNEKAGNLTPVCYYTKQVVEQRKDSNQVGIGTTLCEVNDNGAGLAKTTLYNPVYVFQYEYTYVFPAAQRARLSDAYRSLTNATGEYLGVTWVMNYYTYRDSRGNFLPWVNPHQNNQNGGWLVYEARPL